MTRPRVCIVFTGGTISMEVDPISGGPVPSLSGAQILERVPGVHQLAEIRTFDFGLLPGPHMTPDRMWDLRQLVSGLLQDSTVDGIVVTHGTDTLEETAYVIERSLAPAKPVVFVGAMRNSSELSWDGPANLRSAVRLAGTPACASLGTVITMNDQIVHALDATKSHTESVDTFRGRDFGAVGVLEKDAVIVTRSVRRRPALAGNGPGGEVEIVTMSSGCSGRLLLAALDSGVSGVVIQGLGRGNIPVTAIPAVEQASKSGVPLVICSRCPQGRVLDTYAYAGSGRHLRRLGVILGGWLPAHKARLELRLALGAGLDVDQIRELFESQ